MPKARATGRLSDRHAVKVRLRRASLNTVCEEARCPNMSECFKSHTATFLILGEVCTRRCRFCAIQKDREATEVDPGEPGRLAAAVSELELAHAVITSVTRDDLPDGGAGQFADCIAEIKKLCPQVTVEVLVPDLGGDLESLQVVLDAGPQVLNHNLETVPRLYSRVRPGADYERSLKIISRAARHGGLLVKSGLMVGLGETDREIVQVLVELERAGCQVVTIGQYLQPRPGCLPVEREVTAEQFAGFDREGERIGLTVVSGSLVRSSYHAREVLADCLKSGARSE